MKGSAGDGRAVGPIETLQPPRADPLLLIRFGWSSIVGRLLLILGQDREGGCIHGGAIVAQF